MHRTRVWITFGCCLFVTTIFANAQTRKAGLWEVTTTMTFLQSPFPAGMAAPANTPFAPGPHTSQICVTQEQIDKYGTPLGQNRGDCQVTDVVKRSDGMTASMTCSGRVTGNGKMEASWTDSDHSTSKVHFSGTMQAGPAPKPIEWSSDSTSVFKSSDCGDVKPLVMPSK